MKKFFYLLCVFLLGVAAQASSAEYIAPNNPFLKYEGRVLVDKDSVSFCYPGTAVRVAFTGSSIAVDLKNNAGYYWVEVDNKKPFKICTHGKKGRSSIYMLADSLDAGVHNVQLTLVNEGLFSRPQLYRFVFDDSSKLMNVRMKKHRIEFIGNSMTCGYGVEDNSEFHGFADSTENFALAYAGLVSRRFDAEPMVVARSGIGIYRNYAGPRRGSFNPLPSFYDRTFIFGSPAWNFSLFSPELVCICLGTNDLSAARYSMRLFHMAYFHFVEHVRSIYPGAKIVLISGSMLTGKRLHDQRILLNGVYQRLKDMGVDNIYRFDFSPLDPSLGYRTDYHPSIRQQRVMADELTRFIETTMGW